MKKTEAAFQCFSGLFAAVAINAITATYYVQIYSRDVKYTRFNKRYLSLFFVSSLEEDPLYIAYADMMAKVSH